MKRYAGEWPMAEAVAGEWVRAEDALEIKSNLEWCVCMMYHYEVISISRCCELLMISAPEVRNMYDKWIAERGV